MRKNNKTHIIFFTIAIALLLAGFIILLSASSVRGIEEHKDSWYYIKHQLQMGILIGLPGFLLLSRIDYRKWKK